MAQVVVVQSPQIIMDPRSEYSCCPEAHCELSECSALICLILSIFLPGTNFLLAAILDCNCMTWLYGVLCALLTPVCLVGYIMSIKFSYTNYKII